MPNQSNKIAQVWALLAPYARLQSLEKGAILLQDGQISQHAYYVQSGCLRSWFNHDGKDVSVQFFLAGSFVASFESFTNNTPSPYVLQSILPSQVWQIAKNDVLALMQKHKELQALAFEMVCERFSEYQRLFVSSIKNTPEQRYVELIQNQPELIDLIPNHYLASYLGITAVSFSRIKNRQKNCP